jgi:protein translocase SecG subunit
MDVWLKIIQIVVSVILLILILIQSKGVGLSSAFGGGGEVYFARRGAERLVFILTVVIALVFITSSLFNVWFT